MSPPPATPQLDPGRLPRHVAIIMDGNGRWAKKRGGLRVFGHRSAIKSVREVTEASAELGIPYLTLFAFSAENWNRPSMEVKALMELLMDTLHSETDDLHKNNVRIETIGELGRLPGHTRIALEEARALTARNTGLCLTLALSYGSRQDILAATRRLAHDICSGAVQPDALDERLFSAYLSTHGIPDPELLIRTSGEFRISNFLLWEIAYAELFVTPKLWPDFRKPDFHEALADFQRRERRFGRTSEQLEPQ